MSNKIQIRKKGNVTLPIDMRRKYDLNDGDVLTIIDLGDGSFFLTPRITQIDRLGDRIVDIMEEEGVSLEDILTALDEERSSYYQERYAEA
jgi:bifunctional DNA-binding transcriptional regulator/antitoxin component of YhaV-PrlF toxin-antitoxin module